MTKLIRCAMVQFDGGANFYVGQTTEEVQDQVLAFVDYWAPHEGVEMLEGWTGEQRISAYFSECYEEGVTFGDAELPDGEPLEIQCFGMKGTTLAENDDEIEYFDIWVRKTEADEGGQIDVLEEIDDIPTRALADIIIGLLEHKYPEAGVEFLP